MILFTMSKLMSALVSSFVDEVVLIQNVFGNATV